MARDTDLVQYLAERSGDLNDSRRQLLDAFCPGVLAKPAYDAARDAAVDAEITLACWHALNQAVESTDNGAVIAPFVRVNGSPVQNGRGATWVQIVHPDMPFITDSVLMEVTHRELGLHFLHNVTVPVQLDDSGVAGIGAEPEAMNVTFVHIEIDAESAQDHAVLQASVEESLRDVRSVVADFVPMKRRVRDLIDELTGLAVAHPNKVSEIHEATEFLDWLLADHFTFLGFRKFDFSDGHLRQVPDSELGTLRNRAPATVRAIDSLPDESRAFLLEEKILSFSKAGTRSRVHRRAYPDYVGVKHFDARGRVIGESGFLGLYTSPVYSERPRSIPVVRDKVRDIIENSGFPPNGFDSKVLAQVLSTYPRDELFQAPLESLRATALAVAHIHERRQIRVFFRKGRYGLFVNCVVYIPRDLFNTHVRLGIQRLLTERLHAVDVEFDVFISESILVRLQVILRVDPARQADFDAQALEQEIIALAQDWREELTHELMDVDRALVADFASAFPTAYRERFSIVDAVFDVGRLKGLNATNDLALRFYRPSDMPETEVRLKVFHHGAPLALSSLIPMLEHLGFCVQGVHPYQISARSVERSIQDFHLTNDAAVNVPHVAERFEEALIDIWRGHVENDPFNQLVLRAGLSSREAALLRAYARYMKQSRFGFSQQFIAETLAKYPQNAGALVAYFLARFAPDHDTAAEATACNGVLETLQQVELLNEDRILQRLFELMRATVRTNYFQTFTGRAADAPQRPLGLKITPASITPFPEPKPAFEIFVYAADVEGVHLRGGPIARGGIRWSDRLEDYRTEILGLMKAQTVKNAVIVPTGAKGGFVLKRDLTGLDRDARQAAGVAGYRAFIGTLLDVTDNLVDGRVVQPASVTVHDGDDPYLVVAADKGTATFSDIANGIAEERGFWLNDAFASGGSNGYDHKKMGITARGAWVSVTRHFHELGVDVANDPFTVVGIGDMSGDVFGNGMLLSRSLQLVAAFNHLHVFVDPNPDAEAAFAERERLFALPRSSWTDYNSALISAGGGVFERASKSVTITPQMRERFGIDRDTLSPDELISALLRAPVDLLWNGGIGTYVKASFESQADADDRANDAVRVNARDLSARVVGEGGNLGFTQNGRVEFALAGGAINTDYIDNAAGVDCSDHEVNIKILINQAVADGVCDAASREQELAALEDDVAELVLRNNRRQTRMISLVERHCRDRAGEYQRFARDVAADLGVDLAAEGVPNDEVLADRAGGSLLYTRPELSALLGFAKIHLKTHLLSNGPLDDQAFTELYAREFPEALVQRYPEALARHQLKREITATQVANHLVEHMGPTFVHRLGEFTGSGASEIVRTYLTVNDIFAISARFRDIDTSGQAPEAQYALMLEWIRLGRRATRWLLRHPLGESQRQRVIPLAQELLQSPQNLVDSGGPGRGGRRRHCNRCSSS